MMSELLSTIAGKILVGLSGLLVLGFIAGAYAYWQHVIESRATITQQRDQLAQAIKDRDAAIADRNRIVAQMTALPEVRKRLCAVRGAGDPCCTKAAKCEP